MLRAEGTYGCSGLQHRRHCAAGGSLRLNLGVRDGRLSALFRPVGVSVEAIARCLGSPALRRRVSDMRREFAKKSRPYSFFLCYTFRLTSRGPRWVCITVSLPRSPSMLYMVLQFAIVTRERSGARTDLRSLAVISCSLLETPDS